MNEDMLSIIVLTYKHGKFLYETLDSVLSQDYPRIQLIVAEDGAKDFDTDAVRLYITTHAKSNLIDCKILHPSTNSGTVKNLNKGLNEAQGGYIKIIAGDDTFASANVASNQVAYLKANLDKMLVVGSIVECDANMVPIETGNQNSEIVEKVMNGSREQMLRYFCRSNSSFIATQAICFRKEFFIKRGTYDERFKLIEDLPMAVRIISEDIPFGYQNSPCVNHRGSVGVSTSSNPFEASKVPYYQDLLSYYDLILEPVKNIVGKTFVNMRRALIAFRIEYSQIKKENGSGINRAGLIVKNIAPITYYAFSRFGRFLNYVKH